MTPLILRIIVIMVGVFMLMIGFISYARRHMTDNFLLAWNVMGLCFILLAALPVVSNWSYVLCSPNYIWVGLLVLIMVVAFYRLAVTVSLLQRRNHELAMQVSLLNQENERILNALKEITGKEIAEI